jgi:hypothetical protein
MFLCGFGLWFTAIYITCIVYAVGQGSSVFRRVVVAEHLAILYVLIIKLTMGTRRRVWRGR